MLYLKPIMCVRGSSNASLAQCQHRLQPRLSVWSLNHGIHVTENFTSVCYPCRRHLNISVRAGFSRELNKAHEEQSFRRGRKTSSLHQYWLRSYESYGRYAVQEDRLQDASLFHVQTQVSEP